MFVDSFCPYFHAVASWKQRLPSQTKWEKRCKSGEQRNREGSSWKTCLFGAANGPGELWPHSLRFMQCSLMMLWCVCALRCATCRVATLLIALHKLQHVTLFLWTAGDKLHCVQSGQQIKWLHMFAGESSAVDIMKSRKSLPPRTSVSSKTTFASFVQRKNDRVGSVIKLCR